MDLKKVHNTSKPLDALVFQTCNVCLARTDANILLERTQLRGWILEKQTLVAEWQLRPFLVWFVLRYHRLANSRD